MGDDSAEDNRCKQSNFKINFVMCTSDSEEESYEYKWEKMTHMSTVNSPTTNID